jgi:hypothetical protein
MDFKILDISIGTIFIFLLLSLFATTIMELVATWLGMRATVLKKAITRMLDDSTGKKTFSDKFYSTPAIKYLGEEGSFWQKNKSKKPSYLMPNNFSKAVLDMILNLKNAQTLSKETIESGLDEMKITTPESSGYIRSLLRDANDDIEKFKTALEQWFNDTMDRANGWYKRKTQYFLLVIGFLIALGFNADTFQIVRYLNDNPQARAEMVEQAKVYVQEHQAQQNGGDEEEVSMDASEKADYLLDRAAQERDALFANAGGAIGWGSDGFVKGIYRAEFTKYLGFLLTALAISLGASFWFDLLKKLINIRGSGVNPEEKKDDKKK